MPLADSEHKYAILPHILPWGSPLWQCLQNYLVQSGRGKRILFSWRMFVLQPFLWSLYIKLYKCLYHQSLESCHEGSYEILIIVGVLFALYLDLFSHDNIHTPTNTVLVHCTDKTICNAVLIVIIRISVSQIKIWQKMCKAYICLAEHWHWICKYNTVYLSL